MTIELELSLEHINPLLVDVPVEVELDVYEGSKSRENDDPSEIDIIKVTVLETVQYTENSKNYTLYKGDEIKFLDAKMKEQIYEKYERHA